MTKFKNYPLAIKLWIMIACFVVPCILLVSVFFYFELIYTGDATAYASIEKSQHIYKKSRQSLQGRDGPMIPSEYDAIVSVYHIDIKNRQIRSISFPSSEFEDLSIRFISSMCSSFDAQKTGLKRYKITSNGYNLYYEITKNTSSNSGTITFTVEDSNQILYKKAVIILFSFSCAAVLIALVLAYRFSGSVAKPLEYLQEAAMRTASGDFDTPVIIDRTDEIGKLSAAIDKARTELKKRDFLRQNAIQYVSHELKTPVMTILSYTQSILDKVYPFGDLDSSLKVMQSQAERLQGIIMKLLILTRLDFLESRQPEVQKFDLAGVGEDIAYQLSASRRELELKLVLEDVIMEGPLEQINVLAENLIENAVRHASSIVAVTVGLQNGRPFLKVFNDGGGIDEKQLPSLFNPFTKGEKGVTGLGLSIVSRIAANCRADIEVKNENCGVSFTVTFPAK